MKDRKAGAVDFICALFVVLFVYTATSKFLDYEKFRVQIGQSPLLTAIAGIVAWLIPAIELMVAGLLLWLRTRLIGLYAAFSLMVAFTAYIIVITQFSDNIPCSCGGVLSKMTWNEHLVFNILFVILAAVAVILHPKDRTVADAAGS